MSRKISIFLVFLALAGFLGFGAWKVLLAPDDLPPDGFARGNGRIEADLIDILTRTAGRVASILVREGDLVQQGDVLAIMDTTELSAQKMRAAAAVASSEAAVAVAEAAVSQAEAKLALAISELTRTEELQTRGVVSQENLDIRRTETQLARAGLVAAQAGVVAKLRAVDAENAALQEIEARSMRRKSVGCSTGWPSPARLFAVAARC